MAKYIGKRIVPVHCGKWDQSKTYEMLSIVLEETSGDSYIARRAVPAGTAITDQNYWMLHSLYSQQIKDMSDQLAATEQRIKADNDATEAAIKADNDATENAIKAGNDALEQSVEVRVSAAENALAQQRSAFASSEAQLNARMDAVLAAGTEDDATEITDAHVDGRGKTWDSLGSMCRGTTAALEEIIQAGYTVRYPFNTAPCAIGALHVTTGANVTHADRLRTGTIIPRNFALTIQDNLYEYRVFFYTASSQYIGYNDWLPGNRVTILKADNGYGFFRVVLRKADDSDMTEEDLAGIGDVIQLFSLTDESLTQQYAPADAYVTGNKLHEAREVEDFLVESLMKAPRLSDNSGEKFQISHGLYNATTGDKSSSSYYARTGRIVMNSSMIVRCEGYQARIYRWCKTEEEDALIDYSAFVSDGSPIFIRNDGVTTSFAVVLRRLDNAVIPDDELEVMREALQVLKFTDDTLSVSGAPADSAAVGRKIDSILLDNCADVDVSLTLNWAQGGIGTNGLDTSASSENFGRRNRSSSVWCRKGSTVSVDEGYEFKIMKYSDSSATVYLDGSDWLTEGTVDRDCYIRVLFRNVDDTEIELIGGDHTRVIAKRSSLEYLDTLKVRLASKEDVASGLYTIPMYEKDGGSTLTLTAGYYGTADGEPGNSSKYNNSRIRTSRIAVNGQMCVACPGYQYRVTYWNRDEDGSLKFVQTGAYTQDGEPTFIEPDKGYVSVGLTIMKPDQTTITEDDKADILASLSVRRISDDTLSVSGAPADAAATGEILKKVQKGKNGIKILCVGNSWTRDSIRWLWAIGHNAGLDLTIGHGYLGGSTLANQYFGLNNEDYTYSHNGIDQKVHSTYQYWKYTNSATAAKTPSSGYDNGAAGIGVTLQSVIQDEPWDVVILQDAAYRSGVYELWTDDDTSEAGHYTIKLFIDEIRRIMAEGPNDNSDSVKFGLAAVWSYPDGNTDYREHVAYYFNDGVTPSTQAEWDETSHRMHAAIQQTIPRVGEYLGDDCHYIVNSGLAIYRARQNEFLQKFGYMCQRAKNNTHLADGMPMYVTSLAYAYELLGIDRRDITYYPKTSFDSIVVKDGTTVKSTISGTVFLADQAKKEAWIAQMCGRED